MIKKIIAIFFLSLFVSQSLSIKQMGKFLHGYDMTDELPETEPAKTIPDAKIFLHTSESLISDSGLNNHSAFYIHFTDMLPAHYYGDVQTPPPDQVS